MEGGLGRVRAIAARLCMTARSWREQTFVGLLDMGPSSGPNSWSKPRDRTCIPPPAASSSATSTHARLARCGRLACARVRCDRCSNDSRFHGCAGDAHRGAGGVLPRRAVSPNSLATVEWDFDGEPAVFEALGDSVTHVYATPGEKQVTMRVFKDGKGKGGKIDAVVTKTIYVNPLAATPMPIPHRRSPTRVPRGTSTKPSV